MIFHCKLFLTFFFVACLLFVVCDDSSSPTEVSSSDVTGTWSIGESGGSMDLLLKADKTYQLTVSVGETVMSKEEGTYTASGSTITLTGTQCQALGMTVQCEDPYICTVSSNKLTIPSEDGNTVLTKQ
jgi:hypothetical protein